MNSNNFKQLLLGTGLIALPAYALDDYRCTDESLCEIHTYKEASSLDEAFSQGHIEAKLRLAYINQNEHSTNPLQTDTYATSIGGQLKYETLKFYNVSLALSAFISQKVSPLSGNQDEGSLNPDFFNEEGESFVYLGEAYVDYTAHHFNLRIGRQKLDTPLNDRDDIRMLPNTFEAAMVGYGGIKDFVFIGGYIRRWAGYDSGGDISKFKNIPGTIESTGEEGEGVGLIGVMNESLENIELQAWYYRFDKLAGVFYTDAIFAREYEDDFRIEAGLQLGHYSEFDTSGYHGLASGAKLDLGYQSFTLALAYNIVSTGEAKSILHGHGGGPYFTSMEEMTISSINDVKAYLIGLDIDLASSVLDGLNLHYAYGKFSGNDVITNSKIIYTENDVILSYAPSENTDIEASYAYVNDLINADLKDTGYDRFLVRMNYQF